MNTYNPSSYSRQVYWITDPGKRLASYLDYCFTKPELSPDITFADVPVPEKNDVDRPETELEILYRQLNEQLDRMRQAGNDDEVFISARDNVAAIRRRIYEIENGGQ